MQLVGFIITESETKTIKKNQCYKSTTIKFKDMIAVIVKSILPPIIGILTVLGLLFIVNFFLYKEDFSSPGDYKFFAYFVPLATIAGVLIQYDLTLPIWEKYKTLEKVFGLNLIHLTGLISFIGGLVFGFVFWETNTCIIELFILILTGSIAFAVYWLVNLLTLRKLDENS